MKKIDLTGQRFGRLTVYSRTGSDKSGQAMWLCKCDCGNERTIRSNDLRNGQTQSCGCLQRERIIQKLTTHGMAETAIYHVWSSMCQRCNNPNNAGYKNYGGRGITVCERWNKFENFYADMGEAPKELTIERIDNNKGYSPENCHWSTRKEQARNKRNNRIIKYQGKDQCVSAWAEEIGVGHQILQYRLKKYPPQIAFNM